MSWSKICINDQCGVVPELCATDHVTTNMENTQIQDQNKTDVGVCFANAKFIPVTHTDDQVSYVVKRIAN